MAKAKGKKKELKMDAKTLKSLGTELEELLSPEDDDGKEISLTKGKPAVLKKKIKEACSQLTTDDEISEELAQACVQFKIEIPEPEEEEPEEEEPEEEEDEVEEDAEEETEEDPEEEDPEEEDPEEEEVEDEVPTWKEVNGMKRKALSDLCEEHDLVTDPDDYKKNKSGLAEFKKDVAIELGSAGMPKDKEEEKEDKPKKTVRKVTRLGLTSDYLKSKIGKKIDFEKTAAHCNKEYEKGGGKDNLNEAKWAIRTVMNVLSCFKLASEKDGKIKVNK